MNKAEKKTIFNVLGLYFISSFLIIFFSTYAYYITEKEQINQKHQSEMLQKAKTLRDELKIKHDQQTSKIIYPRFEDFQSAIYDIDKGFIFGTFDEDIDFSKEFFYKNGSNYLIFQTSQYYLGVAFIVIKQRGISAFEEIFKDIALILSAILFVVILTSLFLVKLILKPIRDNLSLLDRFIKDTTHELNTPVSTILTNLELLTKDDFSDKQKQKISRIKSASITISNLYEDLVYLTLNNKTLNKDIKVNLNKLIDERVDYFSSFLSSKSIKISVSHIEQSEIFIDSKKIQRVVDNLLSNAIKYSPKNSLISVSVKKNSFIVCDQGQGMTQEQIKKIDERYTRFDSVQGGFGIGFNIIYNIAKEYNLKIDIKSALKEGTCIDISW